jgi:hypothetical protein
MVHTQVQDRLFNSQSKGDTKGGAELHQESIDRATALEVHTIGIYTILKYAGKRSDKHCVKA